MSGELLFALFLEDIFSLLGYLWWAWLFLVAWWIYNWVQEKLGFAPVAGLAIAAVLIYYLVVENPIIGSIGYIGYVLVFGGILYMLPFVLGPAFWLFKKKR